MLYQSFYLDVLFMKHIKIDTNKKKIKTSWYLKITCI